MREQALKIDLNVDQTPAGFRAVENPKQAAQVAMHRMDSMWDLIRGTHYAPVNTKWANGLQTTRNILTANLLGSATLSALSDVTFQRSARAFVGMPKSTMRTIAETVNLFQGARRDEAVQAGLILDSAMHVLHEGNRYVDNLNTVSWSGFFADRVIAASGLGVWTQAGKHAFGLALQGEMGKVAGKSMRDMPGALQRSLVRHGINPRDWDRIRTAKLYRPHQGSAPFLRPNEIADAVGDDLAERYLSMILRETRHAVPEGTVRSRTWMGGGRPGELMGELGRNFGQFKSFGVAVVLLHGGRIQREWKAGRRGSAVSTAGGLAVTGAIAGALVMELKELKEGRGSMMGSYLDRGQIPAWHYWGAAVLQAGGLGIYGDFLFAGVNRFGGGLAGTVGGPLLGFSDRQRNRTFGSGAEALEGKDTNIGREALQTVNEVMPGSTLWYLRLVKERMVMNQLQLMVDPKAEQSFRRHESLRKKTHGNEYWWRPGEFLPGRAPSLSLDGGSSEARRQRRRSAARGVRRPQVARDAGRDILAKTLREMASPANPDPVNSQQLKWLNDQHRVIDGDTVFAGGERHRLLGFDAPEITTYNPIEYWQGSRAKERLKALLKGGRAVLEPSGRRDKYGRALSRLYVDGRDVGEILVEEGFAKLSPDRGR